jgi:PAS domain S-box-containing protein
MSEAFPNLMAELGPASLLSTPSDRNSPDGYFRKIIDELPAAIYVTDELGRITYYNEAAANLWGHRPTIGTSEWCGSWKLFWPDGRALPHGECPMAIAIKEKRPVRGMEAIAERPDGTRVPFVPYPTPLFDDAGKLIGAVNMLVDITDRKQAEELRQRLAAIVQFSDDAIISKNLEGFIQTWNAGAQRIFGYTADEAIGRSVTMLMPPDRVNEEPKILGRIRAGERVDHYETVRQRKDGTRIDISLTVSPVMDADGRIIGASKIARDVTDQRKAREIRELHLREMDHRIRNLFALAESVVTLSVKSARTPAELASVARDRLGALARAHALTLPKRRKSSEVEATTIQKLIKAIIAPYDETNGSRPRVVITGPDASIAPNLVTSLALALHEFTTNAAKYGALSRPDGQIEIVCADTNDHFSLTWTERGGPRVNKQPDSEGFGSQLARTTIADQLGGKFSREWGGDGLTIRLSVPRQRLA